MRSIFWRRAACCLAIGAIGLGGAAGPASALTIGGGSGGSLLHVQDCRTVNFTRAAGYGFDFTSLTTGPQTFHVGASADASMTLCYSLDVGAVAGVQVSVETYQTLAALVSNIVNQTDGTVACTTIHLKAAPGVHGTVSAVAHADLDANGLPIVSVDQTLGKDVPVNSNGEDITFTTCADSNGNLGAS